MYVRVRTDLLSLQFTFATMKRNVSHKKLTWIGPMTVGCGIHSKTVQRLILRLLMRKGLIETFSGMTVNAITTHSFFLESCYESC